MKPQCPARNEFFFRAFEVEHKSSASNLPDKRGESLSLLNLNQPNLKRSNSMIENILDDNANAEAQPLTFVKMTVDENAPSQVRVRDVGDLGIAQGD